MKIRILIFTSYYLPGFKGGGPIKTIKNLTQQTDELASYKIITSDRDLGDTSPYSDIKPNKWNYLNHSQVFYTQPKLIGFKHIFDILIKEKYDVVYLNSFFSPKFSLYPLILSKLLKKPVVLGPRGEFSDGALKLKAIKKNVFLNAYKLLGLQTGITFQASSEHEAEDIRKVLGSKPDIIIAEDIGSKEFTTTIPLNVSNIKRAVFVSRISPMKNLTTALKILKKVKKPLVYDIYGPIEDEEYWQKCQSLIFDLPPHISVEYKGELNPDQVVPTLTLYDFFFMPTKGENYGHVIAEALCAGLPLVISDATPWKNLESLGIGWDLPLDNLDKFSEVIDKLLAMPDEEHYKMRKSVLTWAKQKFSQRDAIEANLAMFRHTYNKKRGISNAVQK